VILLQLHTVTTKSNSAAKLTLKYQTSQALPSQNSNLTPKLQKQCNVQDVYINSFDTREKNAMSLLTPQIHTLGVSSMDYISSTLKLPHHFKEPPCQKTSHGRIKLN
jgi:hypothetical protein